MRTTPFTATDALRAATKSSVETAAEERAHVDVKKALERDAKAVKQLEDYLKQSLDAAFSEQKKLDDFRLGMK